MKIIFKRTVLTTFIVFVSMFGIFPLTADAQWRQPVGGNPAVHSYFGIKCPTPPQNFKDFICISLDIVELTIVYAASSAVLAFIWGLSKFILGAGNEEKIAEGKMIMKWGVIGLFFMFCIWGIMWAVSLGFGFTFGLPLLPQ